MTTFTHRFIVASKANISLFPVFFVFIFADMNMLIYSPHVVLSRLVRHYKENCKDLKKVKIIICKLTINDIMWKKIYVMSLLLAWLSVTNIPGYRLYVFI